MENSTLTPEQSLLLITKTIEDVNRKTIEDTKKGIKKTYHKSALFPYPKSPVIFVIEERNILPMAVA